MQRQINTLRQEIRNANMGHFPNTPFVSCLRLLCSDVLHHVLLDLYISDVFCHCDSVIFWCLLKKVILLI